jgi:hypothetical protein
LVGAVGDAGGFFEVLAEVALGCYVVFFVHFYGAVGANHNAGPAADAFIFVVLDFACFFVFGHGAGQACGYAGGVFAVAALDGKRDGFVHVALYSAYGFRVFAVVGFDYVFGF